jgi:hypothetical protein
MRTISRYIVPGREEELQGLKRAKGVMEYLI